MKKTTAAKSALSAARQKLWKPTPNKPKEETNTTKIMLGVSMLALLAGLVIITAIIFTVVNIILGV